MKNLQEILNLYFKTSHQGNLTVEKVFTDTRKPQKNGLFIALKGENFDGHDFILKAAEGGAAAIVCESGRVPANLSPAVTVYETQNPLDFYQKLAEKYLEFHSAFKIAVTGSSGKTTTKEFLRALLTVKYRVFATEGNLNNQIGAPFSALSLAHENLAVFEIGAGGPKDIEKLSAMIKPDLFIVTSVGEAHLEFFKTLDGVAKEKASGIEFSKKGLCPESLSRYACFEKFEKVKTADFFEKALPHENGFSCLFQGVAFEFPFFGEYQLENFALALKAALDLGISAECIPEAVSRIRIPSGRQEKKEKKGIYFYLDCYNANPLSMKRACEAFCGLSFDSGRKILILGDMLELGEESPALHTRLGEELNACSCEMALFTGKAMKNAFESYGGSKKYFDKKENLISFVKVFLHKEDRVLIKGSRGMRLEEIYEAY